MQPNVVYKPRQFDLAVCVAYPTRSARSHVLQVHAHRIVERERATEGSASGTHDPIEAGIPEYRASLAKARGRGHDVFAIGLEVVSQIFEVRDDRLTDGR